MTFGTFDAYRVAQKAPRMPQTMYAFLLVNPTELFKTYELNKFSFKHVMEHVIRTPHKCHNFFSRKVVASLKVPSGGTKLQGSLGHLKIARHPVIVKQKKKGVCVVGIKCSREEEKTSLPLSLFFAAAYPIHHGREKWKSFEKREKKNCQI